MTKTIPVPLGIQAEVGNPSFWAAHVWQHYWNYWVDQNHWPCLLKGCASTDQKKFPELSWNKLNIQVSNHWVGMWLLLFQVITKPNSVRNRKAELCEAKPTHWAIWQWSKTDSYTLTASQLLHRVNTPAKKNARRPGNSQRKGRMCCTWRLYLKKAEFCAELHSLISTVECNL